MRNRAYFASNPPHAKQESGQKAGRKGRNTPQDTGSPCTLHHLPQVDTTTAATMNAKEYKTTQKEIKRLIWLTHPTALNDAINDYQDGTDLDDVAADVAAALYTDDTFNEYTAADLEAAIAEAITEY